MVQLWYSSDTVQVQSGTVVRQFANCIKTVAVQLRDSCDTVRQPSRLEDKNTLGSGRFHFALESSLPQLVENQYPRELSRGSHAQNIPVCNGILMKCQELLDGHPGVCNVLSPEIYLG